MKDAAVDESAGETTALPLIPVAGGAGETWSVQLDDGLLSLLAVDGRTVMMLPLEAAARHLRFEWDLMRGRTVSFSLAEGMRGHRFRCGKDTVRTLLSWLPRKSERDQEREVRRYGAALVLFGTLQLLFPAHAFQGWGLACVLLGIVNVLYGGRAVFAFNGGAMLALGAAVLFLPLPERFAPEAAGGAQRLISTGTGAILLIWGVQQFSLLSPMQQLHVARTEGYTGGGTPARSRLIIAVSATSLLLSLLMAAHVAGIYATARTPDTFAAVNDVILYVAPMLVLFTGAIILAVRRRPPYVEAKLTGQFALVLLVLYLIGLGVCLKGGESPYPLGALSTGVSMAVRLYVWAPVVLLLLAFNRWYGRRARREVEAQLE